MGCVLTPAPTRTVPRSAEALLAGVVDYAGLFPPAALDMAPAVDEYAAALDGPAAWMLGRFVLPASRLPELSRALAARAVPAAPWRTSAIVASGSADLAAIADFNGRHARRDAVVDAVESKPRRIEEIDQLSADAGAAFEVYVEVDPADRSAWLERIAARGLRAKIRTGGTTAAAFPAPDAVVAFLAAAVHARVPFKATAGLHHAVRGAYRLTYDAGAAESPMYGYLNVLFATAALAMGLSTARAEDILLRTDGSSIVFSDEEVRWDDLAFPTTLLRRTRVELLAGFGSCSFREPVDEFESLIHSSR